MNYPKLETGEYSFTYLKLLFHNSWSWIYQAAEQQGFDLWVDLPRKVAIIKVHGENNQNSIKDFER